MWTQSLASDQTWLPIAGEFREEKGGLSLFLSIVYVFT